MQLETVLKEIEGADTREIDYILDAAMNRKRELYPSWEIVYYAHAKEEAEKLEEIIRRAEEYRRELKNKRNE